MSWHTVHLADVAPTLLELGAASADGVWPSRGRVDEGYGVYDGNGQAPWANGRGHRMKRKV